MRLHGIWIYMEDSSFFLVPSVLSSIIFYKYFTISLHTIWNFMLPESFSRFKPKILQITFEFPTPVISIALHREKQYLWTIIFFRRKSESTSSKSVLKLGFRFYQVDTLLDFEFPHFKMFRINIFILRFTRIEMAHKVSMARQRRLKREAEFFRIQLTNKRSRLIAPNSWYIFG